MSPYEPRISKLAVSLPTVPDRACHEVRDLEKASAHYELALYHHFKPKEASVSEERSSTRWSNRRLLALPGEECQYTDSGKSQLGSCRSTYFVRFIYICSAVLGLSWIASSASSIHHRGLKSLECIRITPANYTGGLVLNGAYSESKHILVHDSLTGGSIAVMHTNDIEDGHVQFAVTFTNASSHQEIYEACVATFRGGSGVGIIPHDDETERADIATSLIRLPQSIKSPSIKFIGKADRRISDRIIRRIIRWWKKHHGHH